MSDIDDVLERLVAEPAFRTQLRDDPAAALAGYALRPQDAELLAATLDEGARGGEHAVEQRTSKSTILGVLMGLADGPGAAAAGPADDGSAAGADASRPRADTIGIVPHTITYTDATSGSESIGHADLGAGSPPRGDDPAGSTHSSYQERVATEAFLKQPVGDTDGNDVAIEVIGLQAEGFEPASPDDAVEVIVEGPRDAEGE
jgi:hypothetical protein